MNDVVTKIVFSSEINHSLDGEIFRLFSDFELGKITRRYGEIGTSEDNDWWSQEVVGESAVNIENVVMKKTIFTKIPNDTTVREEEILFVPRGGCKIEFHTGKVIVSGEDLFSVIDCSQETISIILGTDILYDTDEYTKIVNQIRVSMGVKNLNEIHTRKIEHLSLRNISERGSILPFDVNITENLDFFNTTYVCSAVPMGEKVFLFLTEDGAWILSQDGKSKLNKISNSAFRTCSLICTHINDMYRLIDISEKHWFILLDVISIEGINIKSMFINDRIGIFESLSVSDSNFKITTRSTREITCERDIARMFKEVNENRSFLPYRTLGIEFVPVKYQHNIGTSYLWDDSTSSLTLSLKNGEIFGKGAVSFKGKENFPVYNLLGERTDGVYAITKELGVISIEEVLEEISTIEEISSLWNSLCENITIDSIVGNNTDVFLHVISDVKTKFLSSFAHKFYIVNKRKPNLVILGPDNLRDIHRWEIMFENILIVQPEELLNFTETAGICLKRDIGVLVNTSNGLGEMLSYGYDIVISVLTSQFYDVDVIKSLSKSMMAITFDTKSINDMIIKLTDRGDYDLEIINGQEFIKLCKFLSYNVATKEIKIDIDRFINGIFKFENLDEITNSVKKYDKYYYMGGYDVPSELRGKILPLHNRILYNTLCYNIPRGYVSLTIPKTYRYLSDDSIEKVMIGDVEMVRIGTIGDGSCMIHSMLKCIWSTYQETMKSTERSKIAQRFRYELAHHLFDKSDIVEGNIFDEIDELSNRDENRSSKSFSPLGITAYSLSTLIAGNAFLGEEMLSLVSMIRPINIIEISPHPETGRLRYTMISGNGYLEKNPTIFILGLPGHFEAMGRMINGLIQTVFTKNDKEFIDKIISTGKNLPGLPE